MRGTLWGALGVMAASLSIGGVSSTLAKSPPGSAGRVVLVLSTDCPVAAKYTPRINALYEKFSDRGFEFKALFPNDLETKAKIGKYMAERSYAFPFALDLGGEWSKRQHVEVLPAIVIFDSEGKKVYQGAIDDNKEVRFAKRHYAEEALNAVLSGRDPATKRTEPVGCVLMPGDAPPAEGKANYAEHVAKILNEHCVECHRSGEVAPFSLTEYETARKWAPMIEQVTSSHRMPPWKAVDGFGEFRDANRLNELEIETLRRWAKSGAPRGDASKEPAPPKFTSQWPLGEPDLVLQPEKPYQLAAEGDDVYRHYVLKTNFKESRYVQAMAVKPGNPRVVHHVIAFLDERGISHRMDGQDGQIGYSTQGGGPGFAPQGSFGGWAPGLRTQRSPEGIAFELKPGATVVLQVHYHKNGKPESDQTKIGLYFAKEPVKQVMGLAWLANPFFRIPAGAEKHKVSFDFPIPADVTVYSVMPHMHLLGRSMKAEVELPDGSKRPLILVDDWDFNWQLNYMLKVPMKIPAKSKVRIEAVYDNSDKNPFNPNSPPNPVTWGEQTTDEMFLLVATYTVDGVRIPRARQMGFGGG